MASILMAYTIMVYIVMALRSYGPVQVHSDLRYARRRRDGEAAVLGADNRRPKDPRNSRGKGHKCVGHNYLGHNYIAEDPKILGIAEARAINV